MTDRFHAPSPEVPSSTGIRDLLAGICAACYAFLSLSGLLLPGVRHNRHVIAILRAADVTCQPDLVPLRYGSMLQSPFTFYRGSVTGLRVCLMIPAPCVVATGRSLPTNE